MQGKKQGNLHRQAKEALISLDAAAFRRAFPGAMGFQPTDKEISLHYLKKAILDFGLYDSAGLEPWDLPGKAKMGEQEWYFFSPQDRKYPTTAVRANRATASGYWEAARKDKENICSNGDMRRFPTKHFTAAELKEITRNYSTRIIEVGLFGKVYMKMLRDGNVPVALKRYITEDLIELFMEEVRIHSKISHKNVVKPLGYCIGEHTLMSVVECMPKGNLNDRLHHSEILIPLDARLSIAIGCAEALSYMHSMHLSSGNLVCHSDIKPANILLGDNLTANLAEFGVSSLVSGGITRYTKTVKGNIEYMDPICIQEGYLTPRGDVYSLGCYIYSRGDMDSIYTQEGCPTRMEIARDMASALVFLHSSLGRYTIVNRDLKPDNILLDEKVEPKISGFGLSRVHHADDHTYIPMGRAVHTHNGRESSPNFQSTKEQDIETSIGSHVSRCPRYLSVHHRPLMQILTSIPSPWRLGFGMIDPIADVDLYKFEPWDLPAAGKAKMGENEWCFFSPQDRKYPMTAVRANRATASGYWEAPGNDKENICSNNRELEEMKKTPISYMDRAPIEHPAGVHVSIADMRRFPTSDALHNIEIKHEADINGNIKSFAEAEIKRATRNFSTRIGEGAFGIVYKEMLHHANEPVAVKKLHHSIISIPLDVSLGIAIGCAEAISYMHSMHVSSGNFFRHSDIKPANILLDDNLTPNIVDFGVSRLLVGGISRYTTTVKRSIEYMDPIYIQDGCLTSRSDVYSFGIRNGDMDPIYTQEGCPTRMEIARDMASAFVLLHSSLGRYSIVNRDLKPDNILLDEKVEPKISDFGLSRVHHADDHTYIPMGRAVYTHNGRLDAKISGNPSVKRGIETSIGSHVSHRPRYLSVHHHPLKQILPSARKWITSKRTFGDIFKAWISKYIIRELFGIWNRLTENESQQHSDPEYSRQDHGKKAVNTKTSASWTIATAAPHHATGNRSLLSGFVTEHDGQFVHAVNRVPMKVLARGAVVTDALILPDVWFVPGLKENLVSVSQLAELDHSIGFGRGECCIRNARDAKIVGKGRLQKGGHYVLDYLKVPLAI